ncbi:hypothetical protein ONZ45_g16732 [Pleurotus djamor]|nr:hypothetical protein ONZ45_g16732 [Pleurotus djamor]
MKGKRKRVPKARRRNAKMWAEGYREDVVLGPKVKDFIVAYDQGRSAEAQFLRAVFHEYHARIDWRLADHEDPPLPEKEYNPEEEQEEEELSDASEQRRGEHYLKTNRRIRRWFKYRMDKEKTSVTRSLDPDKNPYAKLLLKLTGLSAPPKARQAFQEYQHTQVEFLRGKYKEEWDRLMREGKVAVDEKQTGAFRAQVAREEFAKLSDEERSTYASQATEAARLAREEYFAKVKDLPSKDPVDIDTCIKSLGGFLAPILQGIQEMTGHHVLVLCGGPSPSDKGEIRTSYYTVGQNKGPVPTYFPVWKEERFHKEVVGFFTEYLQTAFTSKEREAVALPSPVHQTGKQTGEEVVEGDAGSSSTTKPAKEAKSFKIKLSKTGKKKTAPTDYDSSVSITDFDSSDSESSEDEEDKRRRTKKKKQTEQLSRSRPTPRPLKKSKKSNDTETLPIRIGPPPKGAKREVNAAKPRSRGVKENVVQVARKAAESSVETPGDATKEVAHDGKGKGDVVMDDGLMGDSLDVAVSSTVTDGRAAVVEEPQVQVANDSGANTAVVGGEVDAMVVEEDAVPSSSETRPVTADEDATNNEDAGGYGFPFKDLNLEPWLSTIMPLITEEFLGDPYGLLVKRLLTHEAKTNYANPKKGLPVQNRPPEISKWLSNGRLRYKINIASAQGFGKMWWTWWRRMSLDKLKVHGANGFLVVIVALYSWGCAVKREGVGRDSWDLAVKDVDWVLRTL